MSTGLTISQAQAIERVWKHMVALMEREHVSQVDIPIGIKTAIGQDGVNTLVTRFGFLPCSMRLTSEAKPNQVNSSRESPLWHWIWLIMQSISSLPTIPGDILSSQERHRTNIMRPRGGANPLAHPMPLFFIVNTIISPWRQLIPISTTTRSVCWELPNVFLCSSLRSGYAW